MKKLVVTALLVPLFAVGSFAATTWIGVISSTHCGPDYTPIRGDDNGCIVFIANDQQVYKLPDQERVKPFVGKEVTLIGSLEQEMTIGVTYGTQGIITIASVNLISPLQLSPQELSTYQGWMKSLQPQVAAVRKAIGAKDNGQVTAEADKLAAILQNVVTFWQGRKNPDALASAVASHDAAKSVGQATTLFDQTVALSKTQSACAACHLAHRSGKAPTFQIIK